MSFDDALEVPPPKSPASSSATFQPRRAALNAIRAPVIPPPITARSSDPPLSWSSVSARYELMDLFLLQDFRQGVQSAIGQFGIARHEDQARHHAPRVLGLQLRAIRRGG